MDTSLTDTDAAVPPDPAGDSQLRADLKVLRADLDTLAADVAALGRSQLARVRNGAADLARAGEDKVGEIDDRLSTAVRERPVQSVAIAFLAGYLISAIVR